MKDFYVPFPRPDAAVRLICLPHAGGNATAYRPLAAHLAPEVELVAVQLPGRGPRFREAPYLDLSRLVGDLSLRIGDLLDRPWMLMGHSFGCRVAFELAHALRRMSARLPMRFIAAGCCAFHLSKRSPASHLSDEALLERTRAVGGTPDEVLQHKELMTLMLPALRADFAMADAHQAHAHQALPREPLPMPATVMSGMSDDSVPPESWAGWQAYFSRPITIVPFDGGHFFVDTHAAQVAQEINKACRDAGMPASPHEHATLSPSHDHTAAARSH